MMRLYQNTPKWTALNRNEETEKYFYAITQLSIMQEI